jgi:hypothetical protein
MKDFFIAPIAEGKGEVEALPKLLHRFCRDVQPGITLRVSGYDELNHQPQFTERFSFDPAEQVPSFSRLRRKIHALFSG